MEKFDYETFTPDSQTRVFLKLSNLALSSSLAAMAKNKKNPCRDCNGLKRLIKVQFLSSYSQKLLCLYFEHFYSSIEYYFQYHLYDKAASHRHRPPQHNHLQTFAQLSHEWRVEILLVIVKNPPGEIARRGTLTITNPFLFNLPFP